MSIIKSTGSPAKTHRKYLGSYKSVYGKIFMLLLKDTDGEIEN